jgi:hypothetical protein
LFTYSPFVHAHDMAGNCAPERIMLTCGWCDTAHMRGQQKSLGIEVVGYTIARSSTMDRSKGFAVDQISL